MAPGVPRQSGKQIHLADSVRELIAYLKAAWKQALLVKQR